MVVELQQCPVGATTCKFRVKLWMENDMIPNTLHYFLHRGFFFSHAELSINLVHVLVLAPSSLGIQRGHKQARLTCICKVMVVFGLDWIGLMLPALCCSPTSRSRMHVLPIIPYTRAHALTNHTRCPPSVDTYTSRTPSRDSRGPVPRRLRSDVTLSAPR